MLFSDHPRTHYRTAPAHEVICQLRFPPILSINTTEPADFQEAIRTEFPSMSAARTRLPLRSPVWAVPVPRSSSSLR